MRPVKRAAARRQAGHASRDLQLLRRTRPRGSTDRHLLVANHLPRLPRPRPGDPRGVRRLPRLGIRGEDRHAQSRHSGRRRRSHPSAFAGGRRAQSHRRPAGRLLLLHPREGASAVSAQGAGPVLRGADQLHAGGLGRDHRGAFVGRLQGVANPRRHAERRGLYAEGPGHARPAAPRPRTPFGAGQRRGSPHADRRARGGVATSGGTREYPRQPGAKEFLWEAEGVSWQSEQAQTTPPRSGTAGGKCEAASG